MGVRLATIRFDFSIFGSKGPHLEIIFSDCEILSNFVLFMMRTLLGHLISS